MNTENGSRWNIKSPMKWAFKAVLPLAIGAMAFASHATQTDNPDPDLVHVFSHTCPFGSSYVGVVMSGFDFNGDSDPDYEVACRSEPNVLEHYIVLRHGTNVQGGGDLGDVVNALEAVVVRSRYVSNQGVDYLSFLEALDADYSTIVGFINGCVLNSHSSLEQFYCRTYYIDLAEQSNDNPFSDPSDPRCEAVADILLTQEECPYPLIDPQAPQD